MVREYVEVAGCGSLAEIIERLEAVKRAMPPDCSEPEVRLRGDDIFGRHILVTFARPETEAEIECQRRAENFASSWFKRPVGRLAG